MKSTSKQCLLLLTASQMVNQVTKAEHLPEDGVLDEEDLKYVKTKTEFVAIPRNTEEFKQVWLDGSYSTWKEIETGHQLFFINPVIHAPKKPDRVTMFAQIQDSIAADSKTTESLICDMYYDQEVEYLPNKIEEATKFYTTDYPILKPDRTAANGFTVISSIATLARDSPWKVYYKDSFIRTNEDDGDVTDFACTLYRPFYQTGSSDGSRRNLADESSPNEEAPETSTETDENPDFTTEEEAVVEDIQRQPKDNFMTLKVGQTLTLQIGYETAYKNGGGAQTKDKLVSSKLEVQVLDNAVINQAALGIITWISMSFLF